ncbi:hypothetical protein TWF103_011421 [Orbilia oligospora]|nr:hypothetical protein TWF103_011421 [Orbilia oligospora]
MNPEEQVKYFQTFVSAASILVRDGDPIDALVKIQEKYHSAHDPVQKCSTLLKLRLHISENRSDIRSYSALEPIDRQIYEYIHTTSLKSASVFWEAVRSTLRDGLNFSTIDLFDIANTADAVVKTFNYGKDVSSQDLLFWTRGYLQLGCELSEPILKDIRQHEVTVPSAVYIDKRKEKGLQDPHESDTLSRRLNHHASQFSLGSGTERLFVYCAVCYECLTSEYSLRQHWEVTHQEDPDFHYYWPYQCPTCYNYLPHGVAPSRHSEICFGINGIGTLGLQLYSGYRLLFRELLAGKLGYIWDRIDKFSTEFDLSLLEIDALPKLDRRDFFLVNDLYRWMRTQDLNECETFKSIHEAIIEAMGKEGCLELDEEHRGQKEPLVMWGLLPKMVRKLVFSGRIPPSHGKAWFLRYIMTCYALLCEIREICFLKENLELRPRRETETRQTLTIFTNVVQSHTPAPNL